ncbi:MAG: amidohydrolase family protein [Dorea sp.]|jgi:dihydropyrimidinase|nr:amidohydrolase family protein [Dorea sp.]
MEKDIFADYIRHLHSPDIRIPESEYHVQNPVEPKTTDETLKVLKEISHKLDRTLAKPAEEASDEMDLAIVNGTLVLPDCGMLKADLYIRDGKICCVGNNEKIRAGKVLDAAGKYVCPGIIDPHVHLGLFAPMEVDMQSETKAAIMGGITTIGLFMGGSLSHFSTFPKIEQQTKRYSYTDIIPHLVISSEEQKNEIQDYRKYLGVTSFKVYMNGIPGVVPSVNDGFIMDVFDEMRKTGKSCILCCHTENTHLVERALKMAKADYGNEGTIEAWEETHPAMAEEEAVMRISYLAKKAEIPVYMVHVGTKDGVEKLRQIKPFNPYINIETTSPYLSVAGKQRRNALYKMEPPLRGDEDREALWKAVKDGVIDTIGTDNVCVTSDEKKTQLPIWDVVPGYSVVQTHLAAVLTEGVLNRGLDMMEVITHMTKRPAEKFGVYPQKGTLLPGSDADIVIVDMNLEKEVHGLSLASRSDFSIYEGRHLKGWPTTTVKGGQVVMENGVLTARTPAGNMIKR